MANVWAGFQTFKAIYVNDRNAPQSRQSPTQFLLEMTKSINDLAQRVDNGSEIRMRFCCFLRSADPKTRRGHESATCIQDSRDKEMRAVCTFGTMFLCKQYCVASAKGVLKVSWQSRAMCKIGHRGIRFCSVPQTCNANEISLLNESAFTHVWRNAQRRHNVL